MSITAETVTQTSQRHPYHYEMDGYSSLFRRPSLDAAGFDWRWPLASVVLALQLLFVVWLMVKPGGEEALLWFDDISLAILAMAAALASTFVARRYWGSRSGVAWSLIAAGLVMAAFGETAWDVQELGMGIEAPFPSVADIGYLGIYPPVFLGLLLMPQAPAAGLRRIKLTLDVLISISAVAVISWYFVISRLLMETSGSTLADAIGVAYPFADLGIVFAILVLMARGGRTPSATPLTLLAGGFAAIAFSDSFYVYLTQVGDYASGHYIDIGWAAGYNLVTLSALVSARRGPTLDRLPPEEEPPPPFWQSVVIYGPVVPLGVLVSIAPADDLTMHRILMAGVMGVVVSMFVRQLITLYENVVLNRQLADLTARLEVKVKAQKLQLLQRSGTTSGEAARGAEAP